MELIEKLYLQILNLILDLLTAFGADTSVVEEMIKATKKEESEEA